MKMILPIFKIFCKSKDTRARILHHRTNENVIKNHVLETLWSNSVISLMLVQL